MLPASDRTTGISFGTPAEAYHFDGWTSVILVQMMVWILFLTSADLLCGDVRRSPWGLFLAMAYAHVAPESGVLGAVGFVWTGNLGLFVCMLFSTYAAPVIGSLFTQATSRRGIAPPTLDPHRLEIPPAPSSSLAI